MWLLGASVALSLASITTIYESWRRQTSGVFYVGLLIWFGSAVVWSTAVGWEFGVLYALFLPALLVWPFIALNQTYLPLPKHKPAPRQITFSLNTALRHVGNSFVVLVLLMLFSLLSSLAICTLMPFDITGKMASAVILLPLLWGMAVYHYLATSNQLRALIAYALIALIGVAILIAIPV